MRLGVKKIGLLACATLSVFFSSLSMAENKLLVFPNAGDQPLLHAIHSAKRSIDLVMYGFTYPKLYNALVAAHNRGVKVRVMLQQKPYLAETENTAMAARLRQQKIDLRWTSPQFAITHQKTLVIDNKEAIIMTFNFTYASFKGTRNFAIVTTDFPAVTEIEKVFNADWDRKRVQMSNPELVWSPDNAQAKLIAFIEHANKTLDVYNQEMSDYSIVGALASDAKRGVKVRVLVPQANSMKFIGKLRYLALNGVAVKLDSQLYIHAKAMVADHGNSFVGSMNFSDEGLNKNRELGMIVLTPAVANGLMKTFKHDWVASKRIKLKGHYRGWSS